MRPITAAIAIAAPLVLGIGATAWLTFFDGAHTFQRKLSQEKRHAEIVGAAFAPKEPVKIIALNERNRVVVIDRAEIDGGDLWVYYRNSGGGPTCSIELRWSQLAPDGTVLKGGEQYVSSYSRNDAPDRLEAGERGEAQMRLPVDPRTVTLRISMSSRPWVCDS